MRMYATVSNGSPTLLSASGSRSTRATVASVPVTSPIQSSGAAGVLSCASVPVFRSSSAALASSPVRKHRRTSSAEFPPAA